MGVVRQLSDRVAFVAFRSINVLAGLVALCGWQDMEPRRRPPRKPRATVCRYEATRRNDGPPGTTVALLLSPWPFVIESAYSRRIHSIVRGIPSADQRW